jgi:hypothetical protein
MSENQNTQHAQVSTTTQQPDGSLKIETNSYYEKLARSEVEIEKNVILPFQSLLKELIEVTALLSEGSGRISITIKPTPSGYFKVNKRWLVSKQVFDRK